MNIQEAIKRLELLVEDCASDGEKEAFKVIVDYFKELKKD